MPAMPPGLGLPGLGAGGDGMPPGFPPAPGFPGGVGGVGAPAGAVTSLGAFGASAAAPGPWLTFVVHGLHCLALGDTGRYIQGMLFDPATGVSLATALLGVEYGHPSNAQGRFLEATWRGADQPTVDAA